MMIYEENTALGRLGVPLDMHYEALMCHADQRAALRIWRRGWARSLVDHDTLARMNLQLPTPEGIHPVDAYLAWQNGDRAPGEQLIEQLDILQASDLQMAVRAALESGSQHQDRMRYLPPPAFTASTWLLSSAVSL